MAGVLIALAFVLVAVLSFVVKHGNPDVLDLVTVVAVVGAVLALVLDPWWSRHRNL